jgi:hypothetical protein
VSDQARVHTGHATGTWSPACIHVGQCQPAVSCASKISVRNQNLLVVTRVHARFGRVRDAVRVKFFIFAPGGCGPGGGGFSPPASDTYPLSTFDIGVGAQLELHLYGAGNDTEPGGGTAHASVTGVVKLRRVS